MVLLSVSDILANFTQSQPCLRMPVLCTLSRSLGWRILTESHEDCLKGLKTHYFDVTAASGNGENYLTSMALSEETGIIAISSGSKQGNLYFVKDAFTTPYLIPNCRFRPIHKESLGSPIYSLDWSGNHLLVGMHNGITRIYKVQFTENDGDDKYTFEQISLVGEYKNTIHRTDIHASCYTINQHVKSVEFAFKYSSAFVDSNKDTSSVETSAVPSRFLSLTANKIAIWDALQEKAPLSSIKASENPINCASWSPNQPHSLVVCGGVDKELKIIDTRMAIGDNKGVAWCTKNAHDRPIRDAKFNPFLPYWLASAGEDAIVNIWDVRGTYHAPVAKIDGHSSVVASVTWSNIRPENILTASFDGTMRFWALSPETYPMWDTHYRLGNYGETDSLPLNYGSIIKRGNTNKGWSRQSNGYMYANEMETWLSDGDTLNIQPNTTMKLVGALGLGEWGKREPGPIYKGEPIVEARGAVLSIKSAKPHPNLYYCITGGGQLTSQTVRCNVATNINCYHRQYNLKDKDNFIKNIENDIYIRKISEAKEKLDRLKEYSYDSEEDENAKKQAVDFLENCIRDFPSIKPSAWKFDSIPESLNTEQVNSRLTDTDRWEYSINVFKEELKFWTPRLPPGYKQARMVSVNTNDPQDDDKLKTPLPQFPVSDTSLNSKNTDSSYNEDIALQVNRKILSLEDAQNTSSSASSVPLSMPPTLNENQQSQSNRDDGTSKRTGDLVVSPVMTTSPKIIHQELPSVTDSRPPVISTATCLVENSTSGIGSHKAISTPPIINDIAQSPSSINTNPFITPTLSTNPFITSTLSTNPFESEIRGLGIQRIKSDEPDCRSVKSLESTSSAKLQRWFSLGRTRSRNTMDAESTSKPKKNKLNLLKQLKSRTYSNTVNPSEKVDSPVIQSQATGRRENAKSTF